MMKSARGAWLGVTVAALAMLGSQSSLAAGDGDRQNGFVKANLNGFQEPPTSLTAATGTFEATIADDEASFDYTLSYEDLEGVVTQSHIHVGQLKVNGGIAIWLCETTASPAPASVADATPTCPGPNSGTVSGTVRPAQVVGPAGQGVSPGEFEEVLRAFRLGVTYANVHTTRTPGGEIRGQIRMDRGGHGGGDGGR
jgi:hypothetical protein